MYYGFFYGLPSYYYNYFFLNKEFEQPTASLDLITQETGDQVNEFWERYSHHESVIKIFYRDNIKEPLSL